MYYIGVDIGGTFTDCVLVDREGNHRTARELSTKDDPVSRVLAGLELYANACGRQPSAGRYSNYRNRMSRLPQRDLQNRAAPGTD